MIRVTPELAAQCAVLACCCAVGVAVGAAYFVGLRRSVKRLLGDAEGGRGVACGVWRCVMLGAVLLFAARLGAPPLLCTALGVMAGRGIVLQRYARSAT